MLTRFQVITIDATTLTGLLILLTLTSISGEADFQMWPLWVDVAIISAIAPFAISALFEIAREMREKRRIIRDRLSDKLKDTNDLKLQKEIQKEISKMSKKVKPQNTSDLGIHDDEATIEGLYAMFAGFLYIMLALFSILMHNWDQKYPV